LSNTWDST